MANEYHRACSDLGHALYSKHVKATGFYKLRDARVKSDGLADIDGNLIPFYTDLGQMLLEFFDKHDAEALAKKEE